MKLITDIIATILNKRIDINNWRSLSAWAHDICIACIAWWISYHLRFNFDIPEYFKDSMTHTALWVVPVQALTFVSFGLYRGIWRFASLPDLARILRSVIFAMIVMVAVIFMFKPDDIIPRSVLILDPILLVLMMGGSRFVYRYWKEHKLYGLTHQSGSPVLVIGDGDFVITLLKDLAKSQEWRVVGILGNDKTMYGRELFGAKVLGAIDQLPMFASKLGVDHAIIAMPSTLQKERRQVIQAAKNHNINVLTVPAFDDLMSGKVSISKVRPVDVEDLLGRDSVKLDDNGLHELINSRVAMVSGAAGSIGSELCRQVLKYEPEILICFDISEFSLYKLEQELSQAINLTRIMYVVGDVKNEKRLKCLLQKYRPAVVFHAAAYKHVPLMETDNVTEALTNNVLGTYTLAKACKDVSVEKFVLVSTDKAVNPTNVMGASKRLAEMVCQGLQDKSGTRFVMVRFGNVLGSSGSVIPKFREQIAAGGPVTVTHPDITRYFMSIPEATQLVMQAGLMGTGAEIFVLDMGEPVRIADLALDMIRLSGLHENDIEIKYTGLRPGEKLYEELLADDELTLPTPHEKLRIAVARSADKAWVKALLKWVEGTITSDEDVVKQELKMWVEEYTGDINAEKQDHQVPLAPTRSSTVH